MFLTLVNQKIRTQLFKTNDVVSKRIIQTLIIKYGIYANIFAENTCELAVVLTRSVNKLVKLTIL